MSPTQIVRTSKGSTYEQNIVGESELSYSMKNLQKVLENPSGKNKYGWDGLAKLIKDYNFADGERKYVLDQVELMLKLWGTGAYGKKIITEIAEKCLEGDTLDNIGMYAAGTTVELGGGKKANITATNPVVLWINEYRMNHLFSRPREETTAGKVAESVPVKVGTEPLQFEKPTPEETEELKEPATRGFLQTKTERAKWSEALKKGKPEEMGFRASLKAVKVPVFDMERAPEVKLPELKEEKFYFDMDEVKKAKKKPPFIFGKKQEPLPFFGGEGKFYFRKTEQGSAKIETAARPKPVEIQETDLGVTQKAKTKPEFLGGAKTAEKTEAPAQKAAEQPAQSPAQMRNTLEGSAAEDALAPLESAGLNVDGISEISTRLGDIAKKVLEALIGMKDEELKAEGTRGFLDYFNKLPAEKRAEVLENLDLLVNDAYLSEGGIQNYIRNFDDGKKAYIEAVVSE